MIKKINKIKNFGVFRDYQKRSDIIDFKEKNIIYGWNYSGKTTISRLFAYLDKDTVIEDDYKNIEFEVELDDGTKITQLNRCSSPLSVKVFNSDFIKDNLHFDSDEKIQGIKFAVGDIGKMQGQITDINNYIEKARQKRGKSKSNIDIFYGFEGKFTAKAREISTQLSLGRSFDKSHIRSYINQWENNSFEQFLIPDNEIANVQANAITQNTGVMIDATASPILRYSLLYQQVEAILKSSPTQSEEDELLSFNQDLYDWVKDGKTIYENRTTKIAKCAFCGCEISSNRIQHLNAFYSNEAAKVKDQIASVKNDIEQEKQKIDRLEWSGKSENDLAQSLKDEFLQLKSKYNLIASRYKQLLDILIAKLDDKNDNYLFVSIEIGDIDDRASAEFQEWIDNVKNVFQQSNGIIQNFSNVKLSAIKRLKEHLLSQFLIDEKYREIEQKKVIEEWGQCKFDRAIQNKEQEKKDLINTLSSINKGKNELEGFIKLFLNREDITIDVTNDDYFVLKRGDKIARHLSDGEKTAIAFSHFMVMLKSLKDENKIQNTVIFIDDPVSSFDANHIAQVCSMINTFFFQKGIDRENPNKVCNCFEQLFIATHNFELFSFIKDANNINRKRKVEVDGKKQDAPSCSYYMIRREEINKSVLVNIPEALSRYKSEYVYLFSEIDKFKNEDFPEGKSYIMPNIIRRFLEIYTLMKLPGNTDQIDNRIRILYGENNINELKILHNFSHFTSFERITKHNELILRMPDIIDDLYKLLSKDQEHLNSLIKGIK
ncbi:MAG: AAA family ATPase [Bacteroidales bacterium]|nr:AAA family ATPase [Bacteroidales bacterium]